jgi:F-type H+-transporting ATPase subunit b
MGPLSVDPGLMVWALITFVCLFFLLARFAFNPLKKLLDERENKIRGSLDMAEHARAEAQRLLEQNEAKLDAAREETRKIINEGHRIVADMKKEAESRAKEESNQIVARAREEIDRELRRSLDELKGTVANLSVRIARQVIRERVDEEQNKQLADEFIERLKKTHATRKR